jgi:hypothetical protein
MSQITLYLDNESERQLRVAARGSGLSLSKWVASMIRKRARRQWPENVKRLAGAWKDFPSAKGIRSGYGTDVPREGL